MNEGKIRVLLIEDNPADARLVEETLLEYGNGRFLVERVDQLRVAVRRLGESRFDAVLLDLTLPDSSGLDTFLAVKQHAPRSPVVVMSGVDSEAVALLAVQQGAQDYLVKRTGLDDTVVRALLYSVERNRIAEELRQAREAAESASRAKTQFIAVVSHEIRSPMTAIVGYADLLQETALGPEQREYLDRLGRAARTLLALTNDLLDLVTAEGRTPQLERVELDVGDLVEEVKEAFALQAERKGVSLRCEIDAALPPYRIGDPTRLRQILSNLVGNAVKFTERGSVRIRAGGVPDDVELVAFSVTDTGIGIPEEKLGVIFEPFVQGDGSVHERFGGSGLGLAVARRFVELMDGRIRVESRPGAGSTFDFTVRLPIASHRPEAVPSAPDLRGARVLVAENEGGERARLRATLSGWGAVVTEALTGTEAVARIRRAAEEGVPYRLIVLDLRMPVVGGFGVAEAFRSSPSVLRRTILLLPADRRVNDPDRVRQLGLAGYVTKPWTQVDLAAVAELALRDAETPGPSPTPPGRLRVLLAEDSRDVQTLVRLFLRDFAIDVEVADNGREAVEKFKSAPADLVLMDVQMPVMDGRTAVAAIRAWEDQTRAGRVPIVALTAHASSEEREKSLQAGCTGFLSKPVTKQQLLSAIRDHLGVNLSKAR